MSTTSDHDHPQYVSFAHLEALEGRLINRMAEMEIRLVRDINTAFWRQALAFAGILLAVLALLATVLFFTLNNLSTQIDRLARLTAS